MARDAELRRAIVHRIAGEVATKRDLEELRKELEAMIDSVRKDLEAGDRSSRGPIKVQDQRCGDETGRED